MKYVVYYLEYGSQRHFIIDEDEFWDVRQGFWITKDRQFTKGDDGWTWIPASQLIGITKRAD